MNTIAPNALAQALAAWMLDAPPIANPCPHPMTMAAIRIRKTGNWPTALLDKKQHEIVGVTPSSWLSIAGAGWRHFRGTAADLACIAEACNAAQNVALAERTLFDRAVRFHAKRPETGRIGGLEWIETEDGSRWISLDDIIQPDVRAAFQRHLAAEERESMLRLRYKLGACKFDETYAGADAWWLFARTWPERSLTT